MTQEDAQMQAGILDNVIDGLLQRHPWPWSSTVGWNHEVVSSDGTRIARFLTCEEADELVALAHVRQVSLERGPCRDQLSEEELRVA